MWPKTRMLPLRASTTTSRKSKLRDNSSKKSTRDANHCLLVKTINTQSTNSTTCPTYFGKGKIVPISLSLSRNSRMCSIRNAPIWINSLLILITIRKSCSQKCPLPTSWSNFRLCRKSALPKCKSRETKVKDRLTSLSKRNSLNRLKNITISRVYLLMLSWNGCVFLTDKQTFSSTSMRKASPTSKKKASSNAINCISSTLFARDSEWNKWVCKGRRSISSSKEDRQAHWWRTGNRTMDSVSSWICLKKTIKWYL